MGGVGRDWVERGGMTPDIWWKSCVDVRAWVVWWMRQRLGGPSAKRERLHPTFDVFFYNGACRWGRSCLMPYGWGQKRCHWYCYGVCSWHIVHFCCSRMRLATIDTSYLILAGLGKVTKILKIPTEEHWGKCSGQASSWTNVYAAAGENKQFWEMAGK